jgi:hypothetical protein
MGDIPPEIVLAALYAVAWSPGMGSMDPQHSRDPMAADEAAALIATAGGCIREDYTRGRVLKLRSEGQWLEVADYNRENGDGHSIAQAIIDSLRSEYASATLSTDPDADRLCAQARRGAAALTVDGRPVGLALVWRNTSLHSPAPSEALAESVSRACEVAGIDDVLAAVETAYTRYGMMVKLWAFVDQAVKSKGGEPLAFVEEFAAIRNPGAGPESVFERLIDTARRETAAGTPWSEMPKAFEATLVEFAVASAVPPRGFAPGTALPFGER